MHLNRGISLVAALALSAAVCSGAQAGIFSSLTTETTGTVHFGGSIGGDTLGATVEYAVFAPGTYPLPHTDPSAGHEYVYAYQMTADTSPPTTLGPVTFSVGLAHSGSHNTSGAHNATDDSSSFGTFNTPSTFGLSASSMVASYLSTADGQLDPGTASDVFLFTSPRNYTIGTGTVSDGGIGSTMPLPTPIPEPGTLVLALGLAAPALLRRRRS